VIIGLIPITTGGFFGVQSGPGGLVSARSATLGVPASVVPRLASTVAPVATRCSRRPAG
jgi:hypothetical protein